MELRVLGAHNLETPSTRHTCFLVDGVLAVDAGSLVTALTPQELAEIRGILLTHRHFDHLRDLPTMGLMTARNGETVSLYGLPDTLEALSHRLMDGVLYPRFTDTWRGYPAKYRLEPIQPGEVVPVLDYEVRPVAVPHGAPALGFIIHRHGSGAFACTGDTGGDLLPFFLDPLRPDPVCVEVTMPNAWEEQARTAGHLTPQRLQRELTEALKQGARLPRIVVVHMQPDQEDEIRQELAQVASSLEVDILPAVEDMRISI